MEVRGQLAVIRSVFLPCVLGIELRPSGLAAGVSTYWAISSALVIVSWGRISWHSPGQLQNQHGALVGLELVMLLLIQPFNCWVNRLCLPTCPMVSTSAPYLKNYCFARYQMLTSGSHCSICWLTFFFMEKLTLCLLIHGSLHFYYYLFDAHILSGLATIGFLSWSLALCSFLSFWYILLSFGDLLLFFPK